MFKVDICDVITDEGSKRYLRVWEGNEVKEVREVSKSESIEAMKILDSKYEGILSIIEGVTSLCIAYFNVDKETVNQILKYGKPIKR